MAELPRVSHRRAETWYTFTCMTCAANLQVRQLWIAKAWWKVHRLLCRGYVFPPLYKEPQ